MSSRQPAAVSVVIPAHNAASTVGDAVSSALDQSHSPAEVLVVDDGSSDGTAEVVAGRQAVRVVRQQQGGPSAARNRGIAEASGEWLAFLDADDRWHPAKLAEQLAAARRSPGTVLVATDWVRWTDTFPPAPPRPHETAISYRDILVLNRFQTSTVLVRAEAVRQAGGFNPDVDGAEDWDMWLRCAKVGGVVKLDWPYVMYRDLPSGYSKDLWRVYSRMLRMLDRERGTGALPTSSMETILAWHHLRFAVAYLLASDRPSAARVLGGLRREHLVGAAPGAAVRYLLPFLARRFTRRLGRPAGDTAGRAAA